MVVVGSRAPCKKWPRFSHFTPDRLLRSTVMVAPPLSRFAAFALEIYDGMAGKFLTLAGIGKEAIHIVAERGRERVFDAPDFLQHQVAFRFRVDRSGCLIHKVVEEIPPACRWSVRNGRTTRSTGAVGWSLPPSLRMAQECR
jgi:hypothetical protein